MKEWFIQKRKLIKGVLIGIILLLLIVLCVMKQDVSTHYSRVNVEKSIEEVPLLEGHEIVQPLTFTRTDIRSIGIALTGFDENTIGEVTLLLTDKSDNVVYEVSESINQFESNTVKWIRIDQKVDVGKQYYMHFLIKDLKGNVNIAAVSTEKATEECNQGLIFDENQLEGKIVVNVAYRLGVSNTDHLRFMVYSILLILIIIYFEKLIPYKFYVISGLLAVVILDMSYTSILRLDTIINRNLFLFIAGVFLTGVGLQVALYLHGERRHERFFVILMLMWGILYNVILPPLMAPDEDVHYLAAYQLSSAIIGEPKEDENGYLLVREGDDLLYERNTFGGYILEIYGRVDEEPPAKGNYVSFLEVGPVSRNAPVYNYLPQAIGISIARITNLNYFWLINLGRIFNLLTYTFIMYHAIRITPYGKAFLVNVSQIPIVVENVSSYSYDVLALSVVALFIAMILRILYEEKPLSRKQKIILLFLSGVIATLKYLYTPVILLACILPAKLISNNKKTVIAFRTGIIVSAVIFFVAIMQHGFLNMQVLHETNPVTTSENSIVLEDDNSEEEETRIKDNGEYERYTLSYFKDNSFLVCKKIAYTLGKYFEDYFANSFGRLLARHNVETPYFTFTFFFVWFLILLVCEDKMKLNKTYSMVSLGIFILFFVSLMGGAIVEWNTPEPLKHIYGVQGRYFIPLFPLFIFIVNKVKLFKRDHFEKYLVMTNIVQLMTVISMCIYIWEK